MDIREQLQKTLGDAYTLERELGGGGMARVFVATESALGRKVVVKILPGHSAGTVSIERFKREIQLAARLQHPHIVPLLAAGESDGLPYFTMPYVEGESLRSRLAKGGELPVAEGMRILREVATALGNAHEKGIVHRDIKPDNVLLSGGTAMVTDFGVAKALSASSNSELSLATSLGVALGTPAYMAPEQAAASPDIDARADIYAWGILAYELFAGRPPFSGRTPQAVLAAQVTEQPEHVLKLRQTLPPALATLIMRCLEKHAADRPQNAAELIHTLDAITTPSGGSEPTTAQRSISLGGATPPAHRLRGKTAILLGASLVVAAAIVWAAMQGRSGVRNIVGEAQTIAILPLANSDTAIEYLSLGIGDDVRARLTSGPGMSGLRVTSASISNSYRGKAVEPRAVGKELGVAYVVLGEMRRARDKLHLTAELVNTADGSAVWNGSFDIAEKDLSALPDSIARAIGGALHVASGGPADTPPAAQASTRNERAYDLYLRGRYLVEKRGDAALRQAIPLFTEAIAADSSFARAYVGLAEAIMLLPYSSDTRADSVFGPSMAASDRAIKLAPSLGEAYAARGSNMFQNAGRWTEGISALRTAIRLGPQNAMAHKWLGQALVATGQIAAARPLMKRALELDPVHAITWLNYGDFSSAAREDSAAIAAWRRAEELDPAFHRYATERSAKMLAWSGRGAEAVAELSKLPDPGNGSLAYVLGRAGRTNEARALASKMVASAGSNPKLMLAASEALLGVGDLDLAIDLFIRAATIYVSGFYVVGRQYDPLRTHRRYPELLRALNLADQPIAQWKGGPPTVPK